MNQPLSNLISLLRIAVPWSFFVLALFVTWSITGFIHEAGHARACIALGGNGGSFSHWLHGIWSLTPSTDCSIKPFPPIVWAAGPLTSIVAWFASALIVVLLLKRDIAKGGAYSSMLWGWWSLWYLGTLFKELYHAYAPPSVWQDTTQFIHVTGINPNLVGIPLALMSAISLWVWGRIQYGLLLESLLLPNLFRLMLRKERAAQ